jgi:hypothetical protein
VPLQKKMDFARNPRWCQKRNHESHSIMITQVYNPTLRKADVIPMQEGREKPKSAKADVQVVATELQGARNYM